MRGSASTMSNALIRGISALVTSLCRLSSIANPSHLKNNWIRQCRQWFSIPLRSKCSTVRSSPGAHFDADQNTESKPSRAMDKGMRLLGRVGLRAHADNIRAIHRRTAATHCDCARRGLESGAVQAAEKCSREDMDMNSKQIQVIIADDHPVVIAGITRVLESLPNFKIAAAVHSVKEMFDALAQVRCDVLICDFAFDEDSEPDGLIMCEKVARRFPEVKIIVVSQHDNLARVKRIMMSGCSGFVSKSSAIQALPFAIEEVLRSAKYIDPETSKALIGSMFDAGGDRPDGQLLSAREMEVMRHYVQGMSVTQIAQRTKRSMKTISAQKQSAMKKLGAKNDVELIDIFKQIAE